MSRTHVQHNVRKGSTNSYILWVVAELGESPVIDTLRNSLWPYLCPTTLEPDFDSPPAQTLCEFGVGRRNACV